MRRREVIAGPGGAACPLLVRAQQQTKLTLGWLDVRPGGPLREWVEGLRQLNRRSFIAFLGGALARSDDARSQEPRVPVIGFLHPGSSDQFAPLLDAFRQGLNDSGFVEGRNVAIEYRWADGQSARLPELAADLVRRRVSLIAATGGSVSAHAAKTATATIPILFIGGPDPVGDGLVSSLNSPNGNLTGMAMKTSELIPKRLQLLLELIPSTMKIALLTDPTGVGANEVAKDFEATARAFGRQPILINTSSDSDFEAAFVSAVEQWADGLLVAPSAFFTNRRSQIVALAARHALPAGYGWREFVEAGGLVSYGPSISWAYRQIGQYVSRILKGQKPGDLPVMQPTKFEFVINLKTAKGLGLNLPPTLLAIADEVIE
jgi:putative tryptophan/tyrosine transport system substrate-binding protein